ncbi:putative acetyltransferase (GNAT) domain containing protein [Lyophyllum shimeji]|uniref:Acetyltransferase (GNAT) domain containing protein n=1 Tax=Lyophyllum shimeji TaxID=47721 RepID=A0A9P3PED1_LYOSH|nr:putative acetyltransferase (GNAT) domain containing protein [Lyophyllum shimeji]
MASIRYATEADACAIANLNIIGFQPAPLYRNLFRGIDPLTALPMKLCLCYDKLSDPKVHLLVATDPTSNQILGCARWRIPDPNGRSEMVLSDEARAKAALAQTSEVHPAGMNVAVYEACLKALGETRGRHVREDDIVLELLLTHPQHQGKGVGKALLDWGVRKADQKNARIYLEATPEGYPLYRKYGWRDVGELVMDFSLYGGEGDARYVVMIRKPGN